MATSSMSRQGYRSLFWPIVLIGAGVTWLLINLDVLSGANLAVLLRLWPLILIVVGLDLLFGRRSPLVGAIIGIGTVMVIVGLMLVGPSIGLSGPSLDIVRAEHNLSLADSESAQINLGSGIGEMRISALNDSSNLMEAEIAHTGELVFEDNEASERVINLREEDTAETFGLDFLSGLVDDGTDENSRYWRVALNPTIPLQLNVSTGVGQSELDLQALQLTRLDLNTGIGEVDLQLPASEFSYPVTINSGIGATRVTIAEGAALSLKINGGVGEVNVDVPDNAAVHMEGESGLGNITVPDHFELVSENDDHNIWETAGFSSAEQQITIQFSGGVGNLTVR